MKLKEETKIALISLFGIFIFFTIVKIIFFHDQSFVWHLGTSFLGLCFLLFFGYIVREIDIYLDKKVPFERNVVQRIFLQFILTLFVLFTIRVISAPLLQQFLPIKVSKEIWVASFAINTFMVLSLILSIFGYHFFIRWKQEKITAAELEKEKALVQYDNLKNQLNPHFLFNSLTSLNSLIFENPQLASDFLQQLSKVYRYVLDHKEKNLVGIETEINFVKHYVQLLKTRFEDGLVVKFEINDIAKHKGVVPVTLQILIENAIKHNGTQKSSPLTISIFNNQDFLIIENNLQKKNVMDTSNGQGLDNLKTLYTYLSANDVSIEQTDKSFIVKIPLLEL
ncbi:MAG: sensor histidine kinase [Bacteroidota bacterium]